jgi:hypothetical protein
MIYRASTLRIAFSLNSLWRRLKSPLCLFFCALMFSSLNCSPVRSDSSPSLDFTMNYIRERIQASFGYDLKDKDQVVIIDADGGISISWSYYNPIGTQDGIRTNYDHAQVDFNVRDLANDGISSLSDQQVWLECSDKLFCIHESRKRHTGPLTEIYFVSETSQKIANALAHFRELVGGSRVAKDPS